MPRKNFNPGVYLNRIPRPRQRVLQNKLLQWYHAAHRVLPWRKQRGAYAIWVSEVMLQQTQTAKVLEYYAPFLRRFPRVETLAAAPLDDVLKAWEGMGYYARARNLHRAAKYVHENLRGRLPRDYEALLQIPGIGPYTAAAVASIAFNRDHAVVDGNVERVLSRLFRIALPPKDHRAKQLFRELAQAFLYPGRACVWNQALMELGALICTPKRPKCSECPAKKYCCAYNQLRDPAQLPARRRKPVLPHYDIVVGLVRKNNLLLIDQRKPEGLLGGLWEFPGGGVNPGETHAQALPLRLREGLAIETVMGKNFLQVKHGYSHFRVTLHVYHCDYISGEPQALTCQQWKWVHPKDLKNYAFSTANRRIIAALMQEAGSV